MLNLNANGLFTFRPVTAAEAQKARAAGFFAGNVRGGGQTFYTTDYRVAARLREYANQTALDEIKRHLIIVSPWTLPLPLPPKGLKLLDHQPGAVRFALERDRSYLGLDPGLGKTPIAAMIASVMCDVVTYITPPFLVQNIVGEFKKWAPKLKVAVFQAAVRQAKGRSLAARRRAAARELERYQRMVECDVLVVPDSLLTRPGLTRLVEKRGIYAERTMIIDEAHRFKSPDAARTRALLGFRGEKGLVDYCQRSVYMSGTPMPNRPIELFPVLKKAAPETIDFADQFKFGVKYCAGFKSRWGWDFTGASNIRELAHRVKAPTGPFMYRLNKSILKLPPKIEEVFLITGKMDGALTALNKMVEAKYKKADDLIHAALAAKAGTEELHIASYRRLLGTEKAKAIIPYLASLLEETKEKIIVFCYHKEAAAVLTAGLAAFHPLVITGQTPVKQRHQLVQSFQTEPARRLIIGNYTAMGVGFTLTAAHREVFVEYDWVPGVNDQASDRAHRIGQTKTVLVQYAVYENSVDKSVLEALLAKREAIKHV